MTNIIRESYRIKFTTRDITMRNAVPWSMLMVCPPLANCFPDDVNFEQSMIHDYLSTKISEGFIYFHFALLWVVLIEDRQGQDEHRCFYISLCACSNHHGH